MCTTSVFTQPSVLAENPFKSHARGSRGHHTCDCCQDAITADPLFSASLASEPLHQLAAHKKKGRVGKSKETQAYNNTGAQKSWKEVDDLINGSELQPTGIHTS
jgi:hypothetical protein